MDLERKSIGLYGCIALTLGHVVGSGIFTAPTAIIRETGSIGLALCVWIFTGLLSLTGGFTFAEITSIIPISGFGATFMKFSGFRSIAFCFASSQIFLIFPTIITLQALTFAQYFMEACDIVVSDSQTKFYVSSGIAICVLGKFFEDLFKQFKCLVVLLLLNAFVKFAHVMKVNIVLATFKFGTLVFIIIMACFCGNRKNLSTPFKSSTLDPDRIVSSSYSAMFAFEGYDIICVGVEEVINPARNLPLAITTTLLIVNLMYIFANLAFCLVLGQENMIKMSAVDSLNYFSQLTLGRANFIPMLITLCLLSSINCTIFGASRIVHVSSREELLPGWLSCWSTNLKSPRAAIFFHITMAIVILLFLNLTTISNISALQDLTKYVQNFTVTFLLLFIRLSRLEVKDNILRVNILFPCIFLVSNTALILSTLFTKWEQILMMIGIFGFAMLVYLVLVKPTTGIRRFSKVEQFFDTLGAVFTRFAERLFCQTADRPPIKSRPLLELKN